MVRWRCPACDREFGRTNQAHTCAPGCSLDETFAGRPAYQRQIYERLLRHVSSLGPVHADVVAVGVFLKHQSTFVEVRPKARSLNLVLVLHRVVDDPRVSRVLPPSGERRIHVIKLTRYEDFDNQIRDWLTEAYDLASL